MKTGGLLWCNTQQAVVMSTTTIYCSCKNEYQRGVTAEIPFWGLAYANPQKQESGQATRGPAQTPSPNHIHSLSLAMEAKCNEWPWTEQKAKHISKSTKHGQIYENVRIVRAFTRLRSSR